MRVNIMGVVVSTVELSRPVSRLYHKQYGELFVVIAKTRAIRFDWRRYKKYTKGYYE